MSDPSKNDEFIVGLELNGYSAFFEQDDRTGYLYISCEGKVLFDLHIYNRDSNPVVKEEDVDVVWSKDGSRCGVKIFGKLHGVIGINGDMHRPEYTMLGDGITKPEWLKGFDI